MQIQPFPLGLIIFHLRQFEYERLAGAHQAKLLKAA
jgi:hypothetical protein